MLIESLSGVRGYFNDGLDETLVRAYAAAFARWTNHGKIVIGRDSRESGRQIQSWLESALTEQECQVIRIGLAPTPTVQVMTEALKAQGGIAITASHNPLPWNGLKFIAQSGMFLNGTEIKTLIDLKTECLQIETESPGKAGVFIDDDTADERHIQKILQIPYISPDLISRRKFRVVFDAVNGAGSVIIPKLLRRLGCEVFCLNCDPKSPFPRQPEPLPENLGDVCDAVLQYKADVGFVVDPDADRLALISNYGKAISEEYTLVLATDLVLQKTPVEKRKVVTNLSTTIAIDDICRQHQAKLFRTPIGEINVAEKMKKISAAIGGEGNGGVILPEVHLGRDSLVGIALILQLLSEKKESISQIVSALPSYVIAKKKVTVPGDKANAIIQFLGQQHVGQNIDLRDGLKIIFENSWVHLRKSNTEPIMRVYAEAPTQSEAEMLANQYIVSIQKFV